ncbi:MAG: L-threonine 3-dehydrogenase [Candidatus Aminicenantia bacterium]
MKMKAIVKKIEDKGAELMEVDVPTPRKNEVLVKVLATSICGTDAHIYEWNEWARSRIKRLPHIMGHEFAGEVVDKGEHVERLEIGDYISCETHIPCNRCIQCLSGQKHICSNLEIVGVDTNGSFAEYISIPEEVAWKNDRTIPPEIASIQEPLGNAIYATTVTDITGKSVAIFGDGPIGLFSVAVAKISGASKIILVGLIDFRLEMAKSLGADFVFNARRDNVVEAIKDLTNGTGADVVIEMAGANEAITNGLETVRKGGVFVAFGIPPSKVTIDYNNHLVFKGITIHAINGREMFRTWLKTSAWLKEGKLNISSVITHKLPLDEFVKGFELMLHPDRSAKIVLFP